jgi:alpha-glucoside transport system permease protein
MSVTPQPAQQRPGFAETLTTGVGRVLISLAIPIVTFAGLYWGFIFLRDSDAPKWLITSVAIIWGVGGVLVLYLLANWIVQSLPTRYAQAIQPFVFVGPAVAILVWYLALPTVRTLWMSLHDRNNIEFVWLQNYLAVFTERTMRLAFVNNLMWMVIGATLTIVVGLLVAVLADRSSWDRLGKTAIFLPMAISMVGAGIIWNFVYEVKDISDPQIGLLNAIVVGLGGRPRAWTAIAWPWNNLFLIVIVVWLQAGYAMTLFSAAIKGIPGEQIEAARVDGANEWQVFWRIMLPSIQGTVITVSTTVIIFTLKIFDVVWVMTGGQYGTQVIATEFYRQYSTYRNFGYGSAIAVVLLIAVIPVMVYNLRQFSEREAF